MTLLRHGWALFLCVLFMVYARSAHAEEPAYTLDVDSDGPSISFDELAPRLSADLGKPVFKPRPGARVSISVRYRSASRELVVRADHGDGRVLERAVQTKEGEEAGTATLLAGNLARDEARELLDGFAARQQPAPAPPEPAPSPALLRPHDAVEPNVYASVALAYPVATNSGSPNAHSYFDFSLLYGRVGTVDGLQLSSFGAWASRELNGVQLTAFGGYARRVHGAQIAGGLNLAHEMNGVQIAGGLDYADEVNGAQIAPVNIAKEVAGVQLGAVNIGKTVKGAQLGVINIAEDVEGTQLGVISISKNSVHPVAFTSNLAFSNAGIKFQVGYIYTLLAVTYGTLETKFDNLATTGALGGHIPLDFLVPHLDVEPEANIVHVIPRKGNDIDDNLWLGGRVSVGYSFAKHLRLFAGGGARFPLFVSLGRDVPRPEALAGIQF